MSSTFRSVRQWAGRLRRDGAELLSGLSDVHDELLSLVWGPRFDREHALGLIAQWPHASVRAISAIVEAADAFDAMPPAAQRRVRELIRRHRALGTSASHPAVSRLVASGPVRAPACGYRRPGSAAHQRPMLLEEQGASWAVHPAAPAAPRSASM